jgi:PDDEXK-like uncharacterized protein DUF3799
MSTQQGSAPSTLKPGLHRGVPLSDYLNLKALGSTGLDRMARSALHFHYAASVPEAPGESDALRLGSAFHAATLEPDTFKALYALEPDTEAIGGAKPRATAAYRDALAQLTATGRTVLRKDMMDRAQAMALAVHRHPKAARVIGLARDREITALWLRDERLCRGRFDLHGPGFIGDLKTTRNLKDFSPWAITRYGYYRQAAWYCDGAERLGQERPEMFFIIAIESSPPHDVGVFQMDWDVLSVGLAECEALLRQLRICEATGQWPGMFPEIQMATLTDATMLGVAEGAIDD